ncbi:MAG: Bifunctional hemolysin/adenylate cyclase [Herbaspirillum frisingense]|uniref:Bifunctional hemolysin/adenylate cyclase n=1 Tax=Herbaspirillum frisingense TaxID=92645 RepID=A0A7V8JTJ5_9BURK|nr:MAG: Bifunctional hemolysin/adenylate cyclase [Herbaspirillum frisingense]
MATASSSQANSADKLTGPVRVVMPDQNGSFQLNAARASVQRVQVVDVDMVLHMADGTKVVLAGGAMEAMDDKSKVKFADTSADTGRLLDTVGKIPLQPNDQSRVLNSDPIAAADHTATTDAVGPGQTHVAVDRNAAPVSSDSVSQLAKIISDNSHSVTNGSQNLSIPTQPTAGDASNTTVQSAINANQQAGSDSVTKPSEVQQPPERPGTTPSTHVTGPAAPSLAVNLVNLTTQTQVGDTLYGSGGTKPSATDGSNAVQFSPQVITAGDDVHTIYASGNNNNTFIKVFNITVTGDVTVKTLVVSGVPDYVTILNGTNLGGGKYEITVTGSQKEFNLQLQYNTQLADPSSPVHDYGTGNGGVFKLTFTTTLGTSDGVLTLDQTRYVAVKDASSSGDLSYLDPQTGNTVLILPAQGVPHEVHAGNGGVTIYGSNANDSLYGGAGNDTIYGGAGSSSFFQGGGGADTLVGSATGNNTASYAGSAAGVTIDLVAGTGVGGDAQGDRLTNIQNLIGSAQDDTFIANSQANKFDGGGGSDTVSYAYSTSGVTVNLVTGAGTGGYAQGDTYANIQNVIGSSGNDTFIANAAANRFTGNGGSDTVSYASSTSGVTVNLKTGAGSGGYAQGDTYVGIQNFIGSAFDDTFVGNAAVNNFDGGAGGNDTVSYAGSTAAVVVNLVTGRGSNGDAAGDSYTRIQNVIGGDGNDVFVVGLDSKNFDGGGGTLNTVDYSGSSSAITANMLNNTVTRDFEPVNQLTRIQKIVGTSYSDTFIGGPNADVFDGGLAGSDTVDYSASAAPVTVDLYSGTGQGGNAQGDTLVHIQNVKGSSAGGNTFYASADANHFDGNSTSGNTVNYSHATAGVVVDLTNTRDSNLAPDISHGDTYTNIQNVVGSVYDDLIVATSQVNAIDGGLGNNTVSYERATTAVKIDLAAGQGSMGDAAGDTYANIQNAIGGAGSNTVSYERSTAAVTVNLATGQGLAGDAAGDTYTNIQNATGGAGNDIIIASAATNVIDGGGGANNTVSYANSTAAVKVDLALGRGFGNDAAGDIYINIQSATGGGGDDTFVGSAAHNVFDGGAGSNTISYEHSTGAVTINLATGAGVGGDADQDVYLNIQNATGGAGNDIIVASSAINRIDGGGGNNTVSYANSGGGVKVNLATGQGLSGDALGDTYLNIQNFTGGGGDDIVVANGDINIIDGGGGNNTVSYESSTGAVTIDLSQQKGLAGDAAGDIYTSMQNATGGAGNDLIIASNVANVIKGGAGINTVSYANSALGVKVNLVTGQGSQGDAAGDTYQDIQNVIGSAQDDIFVGNGQANEFWGGAGNNRVSYENSGAAVTIDLQLQRGLAGDANNDVYHDIQNATGGSGDDLIIASDVVNKIDGGGGSNTVSYEHSTGAVKVNLATFQGLLGDAAGDTYTNIQNATGGAGNDIIVASSVVNRIDGGGNNTVSYESSGGALKIDLGQGKGLAGDALGDTYVNIQNATGGSGDDIIVGSNVVNIIDGGAGNNTVSYENSLAGVKVNLANRTGTGGDADGDSYLNIQNAIGGAGDDIFVGNGVVNKFDGKGGSNTVSYEASTTSVTVDLQNRAGLAGDAAGDSYTSIQNVTGGAGNDLFYASTDANKFDGGGGSNTVSYLYSATGVTANLEIVNFVGTGGALGDTYKNIQNLIGSGLNDSLTGAASGMSVLTGGAGADNLTGAAGNGANTYANYSTAGDWVKVDLFNGTGTHSDAGGDRLNNVFNVIGSVYSDIFVADNNVNIFNGGGGAGLDTVSYEYSTAPVTVDLSGTKAAAGSGGFAAGDTYIGIANVIGSSGIDNLTGSKTAARSEVTGGGGADLLYAAVGNEANTYASYATSSGPVKIDFTTHSGYLNDAAGDQLNNIDNAVGSNFDDMFIASAAVNRIEGGNGSDTVSYELATTAVVVDLYTGQGGGASNSWSYNDTYKSIENVIGGAGNDIFYATSDVNSFEGNGGSNTVNYSHSNIGVVVDLVTGNGGGASNSWSLGDKYSHIQNVVGSSGNDYFYANGDVNSFTGSGGSDTVSYEKSASTSITANLATGQGTGGDAAGDTYAGISNLVGTAVANGSNTLIGNNGSNTFTVHGASTTNRLEGGVLGTDTNQTDIFNAQEGGSNTLIGGAGTNVFNVSANGTTGIANLANAEGHGVSSTLHVEGLGRTLDLSTFSHNTSNISTLDVSSSPDTNLLVSYDDVQHMGVSNVLTIKMKGTESIQINTTTQQYYLIFGNGDYVFYNNANHDTEIARIHVQLA